MTKKLSNLTKRITSLMLIFSLLFAFSPFTASANDEIKVLLDGKPITFDVPPQIINGRTMVPIRAIFEAMGASVRWDDTTKTATASKGDTTVKMSVNNNQVNINGNSQSMDSMPIIINNRTLAPARYVAESFHCDVEWDTASNTVRMTSEEKTNPFKAFLNVMKIHYAVKLIEDDTEYFVDADNATYFSADLGKSPEVDITYNIKSNTIGFYLTVRGQRILLDLDANSSHARLRIHGEDYLVDKKTFTPSTRIYATGSNNRYDIVATEEMTIALKLLDEFLISSNSSIRVKSLGFEKFDSSSINLESYLDEWEKIFLDMVINGNSNNDTYSVYKGTTVPSYSGNLGIELLFVDDNGYAVYEYNKKEMNQYIALLEEKGFKKFDDSDDEFITYYDDDYIVFVIKTVEYMDGIIDVVKIAYKERDSSSSSSLPSNNYYVYKGTTVPCYDYISGDEYLGDYEGYRVYSYSNNGLKKYLSFLKELGYKQDGETYHNGNYHHYTYYDSEYAIFIINTILYIKGIRTDVIELKYMPNLRD